MVFWYAIVGVMALEIVLQVAWNPTYFGLGIRMFNERIPASAEMRERLVLNCPSATWPRSSGRHWCSARCQTVAWRSAKATLPAPAGAIAR